MLKRCGLVNADQVEMIIDGSSIVLSPQVNEAMVCDEEVDGVEFDDDPDGWASLPGLDEW